MFDFLVVGAGLFGAVCARELLDAGKSVLVVEKRAHLGGQCYTEKRDSQVINLYGGHIFHTDNQQLWKYANRFAEFNQYEHRVKAKAGDVVYSFPPNRMTYQQLGTNEPEVIRQTFFTGYTEKMWARPIDQVPPSVLRRIPMRDTWDDRYFCDLYQGMPEGGYTPMIARMLDGAVIHLEADYLADRSAFDRLARKVIYTGPIDALFDCDLGRLEWRGMRFEHRREEAEIYQGCATMNYCDRDVPWLREEEWRFFYSTESKLSYSWVTRSYPDDAEPLYPVNDERNNCLATEYRARAEAAGYVVGGRLGSYKYLDMHQAIAQALHTAKGLLS